MVNAVSFKAQNIQDLISKPQAYTTQTKPQAASPVEGKEVKKHSLPKTILKIAAGAAVAAASLALIAKKGGKILEVNENGNKIVNAIKTGISTAGNAIADVAIKVAHKLPSIKKAVPEEGLRTTA